MNYNLIKHTILFILFSYNTYAQNDSTASKIKFSGFIDAYYNFNSSGKSIRNIPYTYNHSKNNELNVNLALLHGKYSNDHVRGNIGLQAGTYVLANYASEPQLLQHIYDANAGVRLFKDLWLDAGIFGSSHVGFESAVSKDNWTLTRSICAENTPYYEAAAELNYEPQHGKLLISLMVLNGWQVIADNNNNKALGYQINWKPIDKITINASSYYGEAYNLPNSNSMRYFHHFYFTYFINETINLCGIFDAGIQEEINNRKYTNSWYNPTLLIKGIINKKWSSCFRGEYYHDPYNVVVSTLNAKGFETYGCSLNLDYTPYPNIWLRIEGKKLLAKEAVFLQFNKPSKSVNQLVTSLAVSF
jgi:hypothetical protein